MGELAIVVTAHSAAFKGEPRVLADQWAKQRRGTVTVTAPPAATWPFTHPLQIAWPLSPAVVWMPAVHDAFVNHQTGGTRLVTTQASYLMQAWLDAARVHDVLLLASADRASLNQHAPEVLAQRGVFRRALIQDPISTERSNESPPTEPVSDEAGRSGAIDLLANAMRTTNAGERLALCVQALDYERTAPALLAAASACMEVNDLDAAARDLDEALTLAPEWAAAHFERGKLWLRVDDMEHASVAFREAAERMPGFPSAWANLGATLGELDRTEEALAAFEHALQCDPTSHQALNNIGVLKRETGQLAESEAAFRQVTVLAPELAFGYYNLGHTLFLQGRYHAALSAYVEGQRRDRERNPVQASRLAMCRLATGDAATALAELQRATGGLPQGYKRQLLADTNAIAWALLTHRPELPGWKQINDWLNSEMAK